MPDIRLDTSFPSHPKTRKLRKLGGPGIIDSLITLWCYAGLYKQNGTLSNMDDSDIAFAADFKCEQDRPDQFVRILIDTGFIDDLEPRKLHDWKDHQGWIVKAPQRKKQAREAGLSSGAARRKAMNGPSNGQLNGQSTNRLTDSNEPLNGNELPSSPLPSSPLPSLPKEKKEEKSPFSNQENTADVVRQGLSNALKADNNQIRRHLIGESEKPEDVHRQIAESRASVKPPNLTPLRQSFEDWRSTDTMWLDQLRMSETLSSQIKSIDNAYSLTEFVKSYLNDLSHDVYNRPDKFNNVPDERRWRNLLKGYIRTGIKDGKIGDYGMKGKMLAVDESKMENEKRRR